MEYVSTFQSPARIAGQPTKQCPDSLDSINVVDLAVRVQSDLRAVL
jgi:hypothetical protein